MYAPTTEKKQSPKPAEIDYRAALQQLETLPPPVNSEPEWNLNTAAEVKPGNQEGTTTTKNLQEIYDVNKIGNTGTTPLSAKNSNSQGNVKIEGVIDEKIKNVLSLFSEKEEQTNMNANNSNAQISSPILNSPVIDQKSQVNNNINSNNNNIPVTSNNNTNNSAISQSSATTSVSPSSSAVSPSSVVHPQNVDATSQSQPSYASPVYNHPQLSPSTSGASSSNNNNTTPTPTSSSSVSEAISYPQNVVHSPPPSTHSSSVSNSYPTSEQSNQFISYPNAIPSSSPAPITSSNSSSVAPSQVPQYTQKVQQMEQTPYGYQQQQLVQQQYQQSLTHQQQNMQLHPQNFQPAPQFYQPPQQKYQPPPPPSQYPSHPQQAQLQPPQGQQYQHPQPMVQPPQPSYHQVPQSSSSTYQQPSPQPNTYYPPTASNYPQQMQAQQQVSPRVQSPPQNQVVAIPQQAPANTQPVTASPSTQFPQQEVQTKEMLNQMQNYFEKVLKFMENVDQRLGKLEVATKDIVQKKSAVVVPHPPSSTPPTSFSNITYPTSAVTSYPTPPSYPSYPSFSTPAPAPVTNEIPMSKSELEMAKKMQEQLEKDIEIAKKLQRDLDTEYYDDEVQESRKKTTKDVKTSGSATVSKSSMVECPVCNKQFSANDIYPHIEKCMEASNKKPEEKSFWAKFFSKKESQSATDEKNKTTPPTKTPQPPTTPAPTTTPTSNSSTPVMPFSPYQMPYGFVNVNGVPMVYKVPTGTTQGQPTTMGQPMMMPMQYPGNTNPNDPYSNTQGMYYYPTMPQYQQKK